MRARLGAMFADGQEFEIGRIFRDDLVLLEAVKISPDMFELQKI